MTEVTPDPNTLSDKEYNVDIELRTFFTLLREIITKRHGHTLELGKKFKEIRHLDSYSTYYNNPANKVEDHYPNFIHLYNQYREQILKEDNTWLQSKKTTIQYAINYPKWEQEFPKVNIMIGSIYNMALELAGMDSGSMRHLWILLHLHRIWYYILPVSEQKLILQIITKIELSLGLGRMTEKKFAPPESSDGFSLFTADILSKFGLKVPEGVKLPTGNDISKAISVFMNNPEIQDVARNIAGSISSSAAEGKDPVSTIYGVAQTLANPETIQHIHKTIVESIPGGMDGAEMRGSNGISGGVGGSDASGGSGGGQDAVNAGVNALTTLMSGLSNPSVTNFSGSFPSPKGKEKLMPTEE